VSNRRYTVAEVDAVVPALARRFATVMELRSQLKALYTRLEDGGHPPGQTLPDGVTAQVIRDRAVFDGMAEALRDEVAAIAATGCVIRDIEIGLVDWLGAGDDGREVWLCWRYGERALGWFHEVDTGFSARRPIAELRRTPRAPDPERDREPTEGTES
jgi:hypothetical protein